MRSSVPVEDIEHVKKLCRSLGADAAQAEVMAKQLMKRAEQIAQERNCDPVEAMRYLLDISLKGASGEAPPGFEGGPPPDTPSQPE
jgi:UDP-N-acetylglucosamine enolpyruvyl transferase